MSETPESISQGDAEQPSQRGRPVGRCLGVLTRLAIPLALLGVGFYGYSILSVEVEEEKEAAAEEKVLRTTVVELRVEDVPVVIHSNGIVQPHNEVTLSAQVAGQITQISPAFEVGAYFDQGDILVQIDDRDYVTAVAVAKAQVATAQSALDLAEQNHQRNLRLFENQVVSISEAEVNQSEAQRAQAAAQLDSAVATLEQAQRDLQRTKVVAPFEGRVRDRLVGVGQSVSPGTPLGVAFAIDYAEVRLPIAARELAFLDLPEFPGDPPVDVTLTDAISESNDATWQGTIVRTEGALDADSLSVFAIARVDDPFGRRSGNTPLRIGQPVIGSIIGKTLENVIALPRDAVRQLDQILLVDKTELTLSQLSVVELWADESFVYVRDPRIAPGAWLATTHLVYAPEGAKVEIIPSIEDSDIPTETASQLTQHQSSENDSQIDGKPSGHRDGPPASEIEDSGHASDETPSGGQRDDGGEDEK